MKSRSQHHRLPVMDQSDDWVNGSWTVDCVCGVNFDDGEEMVDCDECGVWVHTRCSRYVKSEKSFSCDKCKNKSSGNEGEETEVAQLLAELPTKTLRIDSNRSAYPTRGPPRHPIRLWTHKPMEERVHVQGVPGGDPSLFGGLSSIFSPELWNCTGHVPKKFNLKYNEFPCWDEEGCFNDKSKTEEDNGASVLFSLSKDSNYAMATPVVATLFHAEQRVEGGGCERVACSEDSKKSEGENINIRSQPKGNEKDEAILRPPLFHSGKHKNENSGTSWDQSIKKKVRLVHKQRDSKKRATETSMTASTSPGDPKQSEFHVSRGLKIFNTDNKGPKGSDADTLQSCPLFEGEDLVKSNGDNSSDNLTSSGKPLGLHSLNVLGPSLSTGTGPKEKSGHKVYKRSKDSSNTDNGVTSLMKKDDPMIISLREEAVGSDVINVNDGKMSLLKTAENDPRKSESFGEKSYSPVPEGRGYENSLERPSDQDNKVETELNVFTSARDESSAPSDVMTEGIKPTVPHVGSGADNLMSIPSASMKARREDTSTELAGKDETDAAERFPLIPSQHIRQVVESKRATSSGRSSLDLKHNVRVNKGHPSKVTSKTSMPQTPSTQRKAIDSCRSSDSKSHNSKMGISDGNNNVKKDKDRHETSDSDIRRDRDRHEMPKNILKEHPKSSLGSVLNTSNSGKVAQASETKRTLSDSSGTHSAQNIGVTSGFGEPASQLEKINHSNSNLVPMHPPAPSNSPKIMSDEELALLLHQELNSSPRVPRVPRMRHAGSVPQLGSPTGTTSLIKRTSSSGARDQTVVIKRKGKDSPKRGSHSSRDDDETQDMNALSPDQRNNKSLRATDALSKKEGDNVRKGLHSIKKSAIPLSPTISSSRPFSPSGANETKSGSSHHLRNSSNDDTGIAKGPGHQTLPGLLAEIMGKGERMTHEELCNAVLPHWPHLRKHNGERYAYSTHSQAVLDCLRNRHEWAQLVDRGPKTNGGRKRRKHDTDTPSTESDDDDYGKDASAKEVESKFSESKRENIPKGKRNARKRRRLALQGQHIKDVRKQSKTESDDGDDDGSLSSSSEDSMCNDDEMQRDDDGNCSEEGTNSDEEGTRS